MRPPRSFGVSRKHRKSAQSVGTRSTMRSRGAEIRQREARTARPAVGCERRVCGARRIKGGRVGIVALESTRRSSKTVCPCRRNKNLREGAGSLAFLHVHVPRTTDSVGFGRERLFFFRGRSLDVLSRDTVPFLSSRLALAYFLHSRTSSSMPCPPPVPVSSRARFTRRRRRGRPSPPPSSHPSSPGARPSRRTRPSP